MKEGKLNIIELAFVKYYDAELKSCTFVATCAV